MTPHLTHSPLFLDWKSALRLVKALGLFPLAIVQAGAYISVQQEKHPFDAYLNLFLKFPKALLSHRGPPAAWDYRTDTILTTWQISFSSIREKMPAAAAILVQCGFLSPDSISKELFYAENSARGEHILQTTGDRCFVVGTFSL